MEYRFITHCRICSSYNLKEYLDLGEVPLANLLSCSPFDTKPKYPVKVLFCDDCSLSQLNIAIDPRVLFSTYTYHSSISKTFQAHCFELAHAIKKTYRGNKIEWATVIDIAANDGCLLEQFKKANLGFWHVAVEPARNMEDKCRKKGLDFNCSFWNNSSTPRASIITATNVLAHIDDLHAFTLRLDDALSIYHKSIFVVEVPHVEKLISGNEFDTIYHEHLSYFLIKPLKILFEKRGFRIFKVERIPIHGGSIRLYICNDEYIERNQKEGYVVGKKDYGKYSYYESIDSLNIYPTENSVESILDFESSNGFYDFSTYENFAKRVHKTKQSLRVLLESINPSKVMGFGASAKGISLLNYSSINASHIHSIVDETPEKQGLFTPGSNVPIVPFSEFAKQRPDYIVLLAWNFSEELIEKTKHFGVKYITPIPEPKVL